ncbi:MAG: serine/threonine-protein kinase [Planctomycetota bacterium]|nr:serine/threonine-protein kinase [Planctomycetota bacterium]
MHCPEVEKLHQLLADQLDDPAREVIGEHLAECEHCQAVLDELTEFHGTSQQLQFSQTDHGFGTKTAERNLQTDSTLLPDEITQSIDAASKAVLDEPELAQLMDRLRASPDQVTRVADRFGQSDGIQFSGPKSTAAPLGSIGEFDVLQQLGYGATGFLYLARDRRLQRTVALKFLRRELTLTPTARLRFEREGRATAQLEHDHVVRVYEVANDPKYPPYLVLEYIDGESLQERLDRERVVPPGEAAAIVVQIAGGLQAAHDHDVVHRDVKPSNVMMERITNRAKLTDFGLARLDSEDITLTTEGVIAGTPAFMSPEQIQSPHTVDGRSDVYSTGVVLYFLLTGEIPFRGVVRMVLEQVQHDDPIPPRHFNDAIPRDLETVCLKAMAKSPLERYQSAGEFAADLTRWLDGRPVLARPVGVVGRTWRWIRRNPKIAGLTIAVNLLLIVGFLGSLFFSGALVISNKQLKDSAAAVKVQLESSKRERRIANQHRDLVMRTMDQMVLEVQDKLDDDQHLELRKELLTIAIQGLGEIQFDGHVQGDISVRTALAQNRLGDVFVRIGELDKAERCYQDAIQRLDDLPEPAAETLSVRQCRVMSLIHLADVAVQRANAPVATLWYDQAKSLLRVIAESVKPDDRKTLRNLAVSFDQIGTGFESLGDVARAEAEYRECVDQLEGLLTVEPDTTLQRDLAVRLLKLAVLCREQNRRAEAEAHHRRAYAIFRELAAAGSDDPAAQRDLAIALIRIGEDDRDAGRLPTSLDHFQEAHRMLGRELSVSPTSTDTQRAFASAAAGLGEVLVKLHRVHEARRYFESAVRVHDEIASSGAVRIADRKGRIDAHHNLALAERACGDTRAADDRTERVRQLLDEFESVRNPTARDREWLNEARARNRRARKQ